MKVLMLNGSSKPSGNTYRSLYEAGEQLKREGIEYEIFQMGANPLRDCIGCNQCSEKGCVFTDDTVNEFIANAKEADGLFLARLFIMPTRAEEFYHFLTEYFTAAVPLSHSSRAQRWLWQGAAAAALHWMY